MTVENTYNTLSKKKNKYLIRAKEASELTIPNIFPTTSEDEDTHDRTYDNPYQALGARGLNNLANKIVLALFPPATAFFKFTIDPLTMKQLNLGEGQVNDALYALEKSVVQEMELSQLRPVLVDFVKQELLAGSSVLNVPKDPDVNPKAISLYNFVVKRSKRGNVLQLILKDDVYYTELDDDVLKQLELVDFEDKEKSGEKSLKLYTQYKRIDKDTFEVKQEIKGITLEGTEGQIKEEDIEDFFVPFVDRGEDYGRSYLEDYIGDVRSYEGLRKSILEASAEAAKLVYVVRPNSMVSVKQLEKAQSGDILHGNPDDVGVIQADKRLDVSMASNEAEILRQDLSAVFLLDSAVRRNAERVNLWLSINHFNSVDILY